MPMGAHVAIPVRTKSSTLILALAFVLLLVPISYGLPESDALLNFKASLGNNAALSNWNPGKEPCQGDLGIWIGVLCTNGSIYGLQLEQLGLSGTIDTNSLDSLPYFRTLSLMDNNFEGALPDMKKLGKLKALYLSNNRFSGDIPDDAFRGMASLKRLFLANNQFTGKIPSSLTTLMKLEDLKVEGNQFQGWLPDFRQNGLKLNVASNELVGPIPASLSKLSPKSFSGNKALCGAPLPSCNSTTPTSSPGAPEKKNKSSNGGDHNLILTFLIIVGIILALILLAFFIFCWIKGRPQSTGSRPSLTAGDSNKIIHTTYEGAQVAEVPEPGSKRTRRGENNGKLLFLRNDIEKFDMQDLLRASAEVLGSGTFGSSYKAVVVGGQPLVVKRYRHMNNVGREEFHEHMKRLGRLNHENLLPIAGYYYRREEKLLVTEFVETGSLASHLHGNHSLEQEGLDWQTRLKIIKGIARGLAYLCQELPILVPHGHLKSSNVLLDDYYEPLLTDYALRPVINGDHAHKLMVAYKSPEYALCGCTSNKTDVWSFGILILEILTGRFPENYLTQGYDRKGDLATWVNSMVKEKRIGEVFDKDMVGTKDSKGEMISILKIGLSCCEEDVERRLDVKQVVDEIEMISEGDNIGDDDYYGSEWDGFSFRGLEEGSMSGMDR